MSANFWHAAAGSLWGAQAAMNQAVYQQQQLQNDYSRQLANLAGLSMVSNTRPAPQRPAPMPVPRTYSQTKCPSCGSREWTPHAGKEVCAYCRSDRA